MTSREQRKQDLLMASKLLRLHAAGAADELSATAARVQSRVNGVVTLWNQPSVRLAAAAVAALWLGRSLRQPAAQASISGAQPRADRVRWMRWGIVAWRAWRLAGPVVTHWLQSAGNRPAAPAQGRSKPSS
jgi:hypothetical protein